MKFFKLLAIFAITISLVVLQGPLTAERPLPLVPIASACAGCPIEPWYPAGPAMDTLVYRMYVDQNSEFAGLQNGEIDITDWPLTPPLISSLSTDPAYFVTAPISSTRYSELQFNLGTVFWNCNMSLGNSACGREVRQAFAHSMDKNVFTSAEPSIAGVSVPIDNPVPPSVDLTIPNPCAWDSTHLESGSNCIVGMGGYVGGVAYHLATSNNPTLPFPWIPSKGSLDFCAAADHLIGAGVATTKNADCTLTGHLASAVASNPVNMLIRNDDTPVFHAGQSVADFICALLTGSYTAGCTGLTVTLVAVTGFPPYCPSCPSGPQGWNIYTGGFGNILSFDSSLYFIYNSRFVSGTPSIEPPCSSDSVASFNPANYMYLCDPTFDSFSNQAEFAPCFSATGDPTNGQVTPTFADCPSTTQLTAKSASYQAQDEFGKNAFTIPWYSGKDQFADRSNWSRVTLHMGDGFTPPGAFITMLNAYSATPAQAGTIRAGYKQPFESANPFAVQSAWDQGIQGGVWDTPLQPNPQSFQTLVDWMTVSAVVITQMSQLPYTPPAGTVEALRFTFRNDIFWQTGQRLTAWDAAFSYVAFRATGVLEGSGLSPVLGVKVLSPTQLDLDLSAVGPFTFNHLSPPILPGRFWSSCSASSWDSAASNANFAGANSALTPCIGPNVTSSGVILPTATAVDVNKILPGYDPIASGTFVGSGPWVCRSSSGAVGTGCTTSGTEAVPPGGAATLTRYGYGFSPASTLNSYFRDNGNLALWTWTGDTGDFNHDFLNFATASLCFGTSPLSDVCNRWTMGIGNPTGSASSPAAIRLIQLGAILRFVGVNWVAPFNWITSPPLGIGPFAPTLYEGAVVLNPASVVGCANSFNNGGGYDC